MITQEQLKKIVHYNPDTGIFTWKVSKQRVKKGDFAGSYCKTNGYIKIGMDKKRYSAHRLACLYMTGKFPKYQIDHINHKRNDNRWCNLRETTNLQNHKNQTKYRNNTSGVVGVCWSKLNNMWYARIMVNYKSIFLGNFHNIDDAVLAREEAKKKYGFHPNHGI